MKLLYTPNSPYARKVRIVLREKGIPCEEAQVALYDASIAAANPLGKVPTLIVNEHTSMFDSVVIAEYLELVKTDPRMVPVNLWERVIVRKWESLSDGVCDVLVSCVLELRRPIENQDASVIVRSDKKLAAALKFIESEIDGRTFAFGNEFTLADAALLSALGYVALRRQQLLEGYSNIAAYRSVHTQRPSVLSTVPPG